MAEYHNETSQSERLAVLENDRDQRQSSHGNTYLSHAAGRVGEELGRFAHLGREQTVCCQSGWCLSAIAGRLHRVIASRSCHDHNGSSG
jgi:hypothetical protein